MKKILIKSIVSSLILSSAMHANEKNIEFEYINSFLPNSKIEKYEKAEIDGMYKVYFSNGQMFYVYPFKKLIFFGEIWNNKGYSYTKRDMENWQKEITQKNIINKYKTDDFKKLSRKVIFNKGSSKYEFVIFTDPECPYCKIAEKQLSEGNSDVYFIFKPLSFHKHAEKWSLQTLSSDDFIGTLNKIKKDKKVDIQIKEEAKEELKKMVSFADEIGVTGTPKIIVLDKKDKNIVEVINGANSKKIEKYLSQNK